MNTSSISYRVADFLKLHPPFEFLEEEQLIELASGGRVKFHSEDEYVFRQGEARKPYIFVIQQGQVELLDESGDETSLKDLLGEGDVLGIGGFLGTATYMHTARTVSDVILYAFPTEEFNRLIRSDPRATVYLTSYFSVREDPSARYTPKPERDGEPAEEPQPSLAWIRESPALEALARRRLLGCGEDETLRDAAKVLSLGRGQTVAVLDAQGRGLGCFSRRDLTAAVCQPGFNPGARLGDFARPLPFAAAGKRPAEYVRAMLAAKCDCVGVTPNGSAEEPLVGLISDGDLSLLMGRNPAAEDFELAHAADLSELALQVEDSGVLMRDGLTDRALVDWYGDVAAAFNNTIVTRVSDLARAELASEGLDAPAVDYCWIVLGSAGRRELLTRVELDVGLVYEDPPEELREAAWRYFAALGKRVVKGLEAVGYTFSVRSARPSDRQGRRPLEDWKEQFSNWVNNPVENNLYYARPFFDLAAVGPCLRLVDELQSHIADEIRSSAYFAAILANDSLAHLPPVTFFKGLVVEGSGERKERLDLRTTALYPLCDVSRVLSMRSGFVGGESTIDRLRRVMQEHPERAPLLEEAIEAQRVALYHRARAGLRDHTDGGIVYPSALSRLDQQLLKTTFRTIVELIDFTAKTFGLESRQ